MLGDVVLDVLGGLVPLDAGGLVARVRGRVVQELLGAGVGAAQHGRRVGGGVLEELLGASEGGAEGVHGGVVFCSGGQGDGGGWEGVRRELRGSGKESGEGCCWEMRARLKLEAAPQLVPHASWRPLPSPRTTLLDPFAIKSIAALARSLF